MRRCPRDCVASEFERVMASIPRGFVLVSSRRWRCWRDFRFRYQGRRNPELDRQGWRRGDIFETSVVCK